MLTLAILRRNPTALVNGFAFQRQPTKNALMNSAKGFFVYESLHCFQSQGEFTKSKRSFGAKISALEPLQVSANSCPPLLRPDMAVPNARPIATLRKEERT